MTAKQDPQSELNEMVEQLPKELSPERDLWPGIEKAIAELPQQTEQKADNHWSVRTKLAASFAPVLLVLGLWFAQQPTGNNLQYLDSITASHQLQKKILLQQVSTDVQVVENLEDSLAELNKAEQALLTALQTQPGEPALIKMLNQVYRRQLELIEKAHRPTDKPKYTQI